MIELDNDEKQIISNMLSVLKDFCEETQCRFCPFKGDNVSFKGYNVPCQFVMRGGIIPNGLTKLLERLEEC